VIWNERLSKDKPRQYAQRDVFYADGTQVSTDEVRELRSSTHVPSFRFEAVRRDPRSSCLRNFDGTLFDTADRLEGLETVSSQEAAKVVLRGGISQWRAVNAGCALVRQVAAFSEGDVSEKELVWIHLGEPDPSLFEIPTAYAEVVPSVLYRMKGKLGDAKDELYKQRRIKP